MKLETKADFKARMTALGACEAAHDWIDTLPDDYTAEQVWNAIPAECDEWLYWFARRNQSAHVFALFANAYATRVYAAAAADAAATAIYVADAAAAAAYSKTFREKFPFSIMQWDDESTVRP